MPKYSKWLLWITRILLLAAGCAAGFFIMRSILLHSPQLEFIRAYHYVYCAGLGLLVGLILMLSGKSVLWLIFTVAGGIKSLFRSARPCDAVAGLLGLIGGLLLTYLFDFLLSLGLEIFSLRVILDVLFALLSVGFCVFAAVKAARALFAGAAAPQVEPIKERFTGGYLLTASALSCEGIVEFCRDWLIGPVAVSDSTVSALIGQEDEGERALKAYRALLDCGRLRTVAARGESEDAALATYAAQNEMRIITARGENPDACEVPVLRFADLRIGDNFFREEKSDFSA